MDLKLAKKEFKRRINNPTQEQIDRMSYQFAVFVANVKRFLGNSHEAINYKEFYLDLLYHKWLSGIEQYDIKTLRKSVIENNSSLNFDNLTFNNPLIFAAFHLGSYRLFNSYLFEKGHKIVLIIDESVFLEQQSEILENVKPLLKKKNTSDIVILNIKSNSAIFQLKKYIEQGYVMSVYLDGNTSINDEDNDFKKSYIPINFFDKTVFVKNGIGKLAYLLKADIIPVISHRDDEEINHITFYKEISLSDFENKKDFPVKSIELIYKIFQDKLKFYKPQWESWLFLQVWFKRDFHIPYKINNQILFKFNHERYIFFKKKETFFLFDLFDYKSFPLELNLYNLLKNENFEEIEESLTSELISKNIII